MTDKLVDDLKLALGDAYTIERELAGGGMSRVFVAREHALGREVVIKVLPPDLAAGVNRERFRREVQLAARLSHPYIVPLLHAGEHGELLWFTMPYIAGESLRTRLQRGPLKLAETVRLLHDVVEALAYAHSRGVVHRDIKPGNILSDGQHALVTDFGVAKALNAALPNAGPGHTTSGMAIGTPAYMAPEQLAADPDADQRVDIYAVGLLAYELLSGVSPFAAASPTATMTAQLTRVPEPLHRLQPDVPPAFSDLVQHCLAKSPEDRPPDAQTVLVELDRIAGALAADAHRSVSGETARQSHASMVPIALAAFATVVLVAGGFWWNQRAGIRAAAARDSNTARVAGDTSNLGLTLPKPLTHQDSLNIAEALRDQLQQIDPRYPKRQATVAKSVDSVPLTLQLHQVDSLIQSALRQQNDQRLAAAASIPPSAPGATAPIPPVGSPQMATAVTSGVRRLVILMPRDRTADTVLRGLEASAAVDLSRRASSMIGWSDVVVDSGGPRNGPDRSHSTFGNADVLVFLGFQQHTADSVVLRVMVRHAAGSDFGFRLLSSDPVFHPTTLDPFRNTIRDVTRLLDQLRRLPADQPWPQNIGPRWTGAGGPGGPGGPDDPGRAGVRSMQHRMDSLRGKFDSLRPRRRDSE